MVAAHDTSEALLRRLRTAVDPAVHDGDGLFVPDTALSAVGDLIGCEEIAFQVMDARRERTEVQSAGQVGDDNAGAERLFWQGFGRRRAATPSTAVITTA